jgi:hypothetical protein
LTGRTLVGEGDFQIHAPQYVSEHDTLALKDGLQGHSFFNDLATSMEVASQRAEADRLKHPSGCSNQMEFNL